MLLPSPSEPRTHDAAAWYTGTVCPLWAGTASKPDAPKKSERWVPYRAHRGWRLCRQLPGDTRQVDFHGGNAQPLTMTEAEAIALAAALNRRPEALLVTESRRRDLAAA